MTNHRQLLNLTNFVNTEMYIFHFSQFPLLRLTQDQWKTTQGPDLVLKVLATDCRHHHSIQGYMISTILFKVNELVDWVFPMTLYILWRQWRCITFRWGLLRATLWGVLTVNALTSLLPQAIYTYGCLLSFLFTRSLHVIIMCLEVWHEQQQGSHSHIPQQGRKRLKRRQGCRDKQLSLFLFFSHRPRSGLGGVTYSFFFFAPSFRFL